MILYFTLFYSFIKLYLSIRFNKIKISRQNCSTYQMIDSLSSPLLESDGYAFSTSPGACDCHWRDSENDPPRPWVVQPNKNQWTELFWIRLTNLEYSSSLTMSIIWFSRHPLKTQFWVNKSKFHQICDVCSSMKEMMMNK